MTMEVDLATIEPAARQEAYKHAKAAGFKILNSNLVSEAVEDARATGTMPPAKAVELQFDPGAAAAAAVTQGDEFFRITNTKEGFDCAFGGLRLPGPAQRKLQLIALGAAKGDDKAHAYVHVFAAFQYPVMVDQPDVDIKLVDSMVGPESLGRVLSKEMRKKIGIEVSFEEASGHADAIWYKIWLVRTRAQYEKAVDAARAMAKQARAS